MKTKNFSTVMAVMITMMIFSGVTNARTNEAQSASGLENTMEPALVIENWMINDTYWNNSGHFFWVNESDNSLLLESWMTDESNWESAILISGVNEKPLILETWMTDGNNWIKEDFICDQVQDEKMKVESWMTDERYWSQPVKM